MGDCIVDGCPNPAVTRGLCNRRYQAWYREHRADRKRASDRRWRERTDYNGRRRKPKQTRVCPCGERFETAIPHQRFHSFACKNRAANRRYRKRRKARKEKA